MFDHCRKKQFYNEDMHKDNFGNHSHFMIGKIILVKIILHIQMLILIIMVFNPHSTILNVLKILMRINPIPLIRLFLKIHLLALDHLIFILLPIVIKLTILFWSL